MNTPSSSLGDSRLLEDALRHDRYAAAASQLGDVQPITRMSAVLALIELADEWLQAVHLTKTQRRRKAQTVIDMLCSYVRSPFPLAAEQKRLLGDAPEDLEQMRRFRAEQAELEAEIQVRERILSEIHDRVRWQLRNGAGGSHRVPAEADMLTGAWSRLSYNFSGATFFYPVDFSESAWGEKVSFRGCTYRFDADFGASLYAADAVFSGSKYGEQVRFSDSIYRGYVSFAGSTYGGEARFEDSQYDGDVDFFGSTYRGSVTFANASYERRVRLSGSTYGLHADLSGCVYRDQALLSGCVYAADVSLRECQYRGNIADFSGCVYRENADLAGSIYEGATDFSQSVWHGKARLTGCMYFKNVNFASSTYRERADFGGSTFNRDTDFSGSTYRGWADFRNSAYQGRAGFTDSIYQNEVYFSGSTYEDKADFRGSIFCGDVYYDKDRYNSNFSRFTECTPQFYNENSHQNTLFGSPNNNFIVDTDKGYPINLNSEGLPLGCKFLTSEQKEYLADKFREIEKINNKLREVKDPKEKAELSKKLQALDKTLYEWREEATTVEAEDAAPGRKE